ncbi:MAG: rod shape-determining protein MreD [Gemmatimonadetes bacterium]|nr:rod shape-determining protein MreD [Gemmatimonadota bacterium]
MRNRAAAIRFWGVLLGLLVAHFALRPRLGDPRFAPDFVLIALLFLAIRTRPGVGAAAGFSVGLLTDAVAPTAFGAAAFATTGVGYLAGWLKAVFFADNLLVNALFVFVAAWARDVIEVLAGNQLSGGALAWQLLAFSPLAGLATSAAALVVLLFFRGWLRAGRSA